MDHIDKITLQLLTNKVQYNKYLSKEDPKKFKEHQEYLEKIAKFKPKISNLSKQFLENPEKSFNLEMDEMFSIFAKTSIKYLEMRELEMENLYNTENDTENDTESEDTMFGTIDEEIRLDEGLKNSKEMNTFWGKTIKKAPGHKQVN